MVSAQDLELIDRFASRVSPDDPAHAPWCEGYVRAHRDRLAADVGIVGRELPEGPLLEIGSIPPVLTASLREAGRDVIGVDIAPERFSRCVGELGLEIRKCDIERERLPFEDGRFRGVIFNEVFEHLRIDLIHTIGEIARVTAPGGRILLTTPNVRSARGIVSLLVRGRSAFLCPDVHEQYDKLRTLGHMGHVREYTERDVADLCGKLGLRHVRTLWRRAARESAVEKLACAVAPPLRPYMTIVLERAASM